jgi:hypothetical protein
VEQSLRSASAVVCFPKARDLDKHDIHTVPCARGRDQ